MEEFCIDLAGIPIGIKSKYKGNRVFFCGYETGEYPLFTIEPRTEDLERIKYDFERSDEAVGIPKHQRSAEFLENNAIHAMIAEKLVEYNILLVHGSALCMDGQGYIFMAASGTGKSTHAGLWRKMYGDRVFMINDDKPLIKIEGNSVSVWGTPWDGKHHLSRNASAPLKAVVNLYRDDVNHIEPLPKADAFPVIMKHAYRSKDPASMIHITNMYKQLVERIRFYTLGCNMDPEAAETAWRGMDYL